MACGACGGYYKCYCDYLKMKEKLRIKELEIKALKYDMMIYKQNNPLTSQDGCKGMYNA